MKRIILIPLLAFLTGCVTHHHHYIQASEAESGAFYSETAPGNTSYAPHTEVHTDYSADYSSARYYPWWSVDYFYLSPYRRHSGISVGFNVGYGSSWYDPFYWAYEPFSMAYSPFYYSYYYAPLWYNDYRYGYYNRFSYYSNYWRYRYNNYHGSRHRGHDGRGGHDNSGRYAGSYDNRRGRREDGWIDPVDRDRDYPPGSQSQPGHEPSVNRHVSVAPGSRSGERGMEVRNRKERKPVDTRIEPTKPIRKLSPADGVVAVTPRPEDRVYQTRAQPKPVKSPHVVKQDGSLVNGKVKVDKNSQFYSVAPSTKQGKAQPVKTRPVQPQPPVNAGNSIRAYGGGGYTTNTGPVIRVEPPRQTRQDRAVTSTSKQSRAPARPVYQKAPQKAVSPRLAPAQSQPAPRVSSRPAPAPSRQVQPQAGKPQPKAPARSAKARSGDGNQKPGKKDER